MPQVGLPRIPSNALPRVGTAFAYISLSALIVGLSRLASKPGGEPFARGTTGVSIGTGLTL
jgi:hypothetical protein